MKAYTDLEQSKKLAEILPIESADMWYCPYPNDVDWHNEPNIGKAELLLNQLPCWSLAALFGVLPTTIGNFFEKNALRLRIDKGENDFNIWYENFDCGDVAEGLDVIEDNPVDACYKMLVKLQKQRRDGTPHPPLPTPRTIQHHRDGKQIRGSMKRTYKPPKIVETYKDMRHFVLLHICYECPFNQKDTPNDFHCVNFDTLMGDDCPIWLELCECYI